MINERPHKKLRVWQRAKSLVTKIYEMTNGFPAIEEFGLKSQLRRAAVSVPSNIAEGLTRRGKNDKLHFLNIAQSSLSEMDTQIEIALDLKYVRQDIYEALETDLVEVQSLLGGLIRSLK